MDGGIAAEDLSDQNNKASKDLPNLLCDPTEYCMCETHRTRTYNVVAPAGSAHMWGSSLPFKFHWPKQVTWPNLSKLSREVELFYKKRETLNSEQY